MDLLTHLFLPITVAYAIRSDLFPSPLYFGLAVFAILPDLDKLLGTPGLLHSVFAVGAVGAAGLLLERRYRNSATYSTVIVLLLASHLLLDFLDGGPVTLLYPLVKTGVGLEYPASIAFGDAVQDVAVRDPLPRVHAVPTDSDREAYPLLNGYGILSLFVFLTVYFGIESPTPTTDDRK